MKILRLEAENIKRLQAVEIKPDGELVIIGGQNAQGKSSVLDSIVMALAGGKSIPAEPIRRGQPNGEIRVDLGDLIVVRKFSAKSGPSLVVTANDGTRVSSPQGVLDKLTSKISFDPLAFSRMSDLEQRITLANLIGLDFTALDEARKKTYDERTVKNREIDTQQHRLNSTQRFPNAPKETVDVAELTAKLREAETANEVKATAAVNIQRIRGRVDDLKGEHKRAMDELEKAKARVEHCQLELTAAENTLAEEEKSAAALETIDTAPILEKLNAAQEINEQHSSNARWNEENERLRALQKESEAMTKEIERIDQEKRDTLEKAKFPVPGLGFSETGVLFNDIPFSQASDAEKLRVSVAMGLAMNPKLKVLLIRDGSLLDEKNLALVADMAGKADAQVWIERVGKGKECSVIIEDGRVAEDRTTAAESAGKGEEK